MKMLAQFCINFHQPEVVALVVVGAVPLRLPGVVELALVGARRRRLGVPAARTAAAALVRLPLKSHKDCQLRQILLSSLDITKSKEISCSSSFNCD